MKKLVWTAALGIVLMAGNAGAEEKATMNSQKDKVSYIIGYDIGSNFKRQSVDVDTDVLLKGIKDGLQSNKSALSEEDMRNTMNAFNKEMTEKKAAADIKAAETNKKEGEAFLAENMKKDGVKTLPSGLQYKVVTEGSGKSPKATDTVTVNYRGSLIDGTEFDSSYKRGQPASFPVNGVIAGWTEALQLMKEGAKWKLFIPSKLAYGEKGAGNVIGPNATLTFEVELISVK